MQGKVTLTLPDLDPEAAVQLLNLYTQIVGHAPQLSQVVHAVPQQAQPQPQAAAPQAPAAQPVTSGGYDVSLATAADAHDFHGVPWNGSVHSSRDGPTKGRNAQGGWKMRKNINKKDFEDWNARHRGSGPATPGAVASVPARQSQAEPASHHPAEAPQAWGSGQPAIVTSEQFLALASKLGAEQKITPAVVAEILKITGCANQAEVTDSADARRKAYDYLVGLEQAA